jgi:AcrR family transcriptional regulator
VTTDEVATALGISKKTLYQHFTSKEELFRAAVLHMRDEMHDGIQRMVNDPDIDFLEKLRFLLGMVTEKITRLRRPFFEDVQRKMPDLWEDLQQFRRERVFSVVGKLFEEGNRVGMLRKDVPPELFGLMHLTLVQNIINPTTLAQLPYSTEQVVGAIMKVLFEGILTAEARAKIHMTE